ncbi:hypothetical protein BLNAU_15605 [Blattamonas nauphoetae]|uniref:Uncharacterized protein n=1 Tax=Blattamonas nauphoetae TaxID=2049346 RepID=A0ABQ9XDW2_9EUKA|nr:hypothetical protein BLNAU_15605 [Blattamonas nauphoetae]
MIDFATDEGSDGHQKTIADQKQSVSTDPIKILSNSNFSSLVTPTQAWVIYSYSPTCGICRNSVTNSKSTHIQTLLYSIDAVTNKPERIPIDLGTICLFDQNWFMEDIQPPAHLFPKEMRMYRAIEYYRHNQFSEAIALFDPSEELTKLSKEDKDMLARCHFRLGHFKQAETLCHLQLQYKKHDFNTLLLLADCYSSQQQLKPSFFCLLNSLVLHRSNTSAWLRLAQCWCGLLTAEKALTGHNPSELAVLLGWVFTQRGTVLTMQTLRQRRQLFEQTRFKSVGMSNRHAIQVGGEKRAKADSSTDQVENADEVPTPAEPVVPPSTPECSPSDESSQSKLEEERQHHSSFVASLRPFMEKSTEKYEKWMGEFDLLAQQLITSWIETDHKVNEIEPTPPTPDVDERISARAQLSALSLRLFETLRDHAEPANTKGPKGRGKQKIQLPPSKVSETRFPMHFSVESHTNALLPVQALFDPAISVPTPSDPDSSPSQPQPAPTPISSVPLDSFDLCPDETKLDVFVSFWLASHQKKFILPHIDAEMEAEYANGKEDDDDDSVLAVNDNIGNYADFAGIPLLR